MSSIKSSYRVACRLLSLKCLEHLAITLAVLLVGCGAPLRAAPARHLGRLQELRAQDLRVASVSYRLALANRALCPGAVAPQLGFTLHGITGLLLRRHAGLEYDRR